MTYLGLICAAVLAAPLEVDLQTVAGESHHGALVAISADEIALATAEGDKRWPLVDVLDIASAKLPQGAATPAVIVSLRDGSRVHATAYTTSGDTATIELADGAKLSVPTQAVHWVRWPQSGAPPAAAAVANAAAPAADPGAQAWQQFVEQPIEADLLVVRKKEDVDSVDGQIGDVGAESVAFAIDDEKLDVKRAKIVGIVYYRAEEAAAPAPLAKVQTADGSAWAAKSLALGGRTYRKGLALHSRTRLVFRLPEGYRRLTALAGIDDRLSDQGSVRLEIVGDEKTLLSAIVSGGDAPLPVDLDVSGVRRLTILVDFANDQDVADHLDLCELRIIK